ncbi:energy transducer TonB [Psychromonas sp. psych-6C06]|uniref:energy transducer TonB n=1 Tax=Psychromonas sp. psych-6C06 TaxID=2058089 RepID=UPI000C337426|nr:energy transducer TonB [Psychromonas sp. psych-6C06]PKF61820.1 energy transducer TonB [Psychromonas sp. psych-6C06]
MRLLFAFIGAPVMTCALLYFMASLINQPIAMQRDKHSNPYFELLVNNQDESYESRTRSKPIPPKNKPEPEMPTTEVQQSQIASPDMSVALEIPSLDLSNNVSAMAISMPGIASVAPPVAGASHDNSAMPLYRVQPRYPRRALRLGKQGYVVLSFDINEVGRVININIIEAQPKRLFEKEAKRALKQWKYKPMVVNGEAVPQRGQRIRLDFEMENKK